MTTRTRGRLMVCLTLALVALPVEALILPVAMTPEPAEAAREFTAAMSPVELAAAAAEIDAYPAVYRRAIMQELSADARADVWRGRFEAYLELAPRLDAVAGGRRARRPRPGVAGTVYDVAGRRDTRRAWARCSSARWPSSARGPRASCS